MKFLECTNSINSSYILLNVDEIKYIYTEYKSKVFTVMIKTKVNEEFVLKCFDDEDDVIRYIDDLSGKLND